MNKLLRFAYRWASTIIEPLRLIRAIPGYFWYFGDMWKYSRSPGAEKLRLIDTFPILADKTSSTPFDPHYLYQANWGFRKIRDSKTKVHIDVGSDIRFVSLLGAITDVEFVDIRPLNVKIDGFHCKEGSILKLPYLDNSVKSLSCMHVVEHIGLGRYGDPIDPLGSEKAMKELKRVLAPGGNLYFTVPTGRSKVCFNANKIFSPQQVIGFFSGLDLVEFSGVKDNKDFLENISIDKLENEEYGCGMYHFRK